MKTALIVIGAVLLTLAVIAAAALHYLLLI